MGKTNEFLLFFFSIFLLDRYKIINWNLLVFLLESSEVKTRKNSIGISVYQLDMEVKDKLSLYLNKLNFKFVLK